MAYDTATDQVHCVTGFAAGVFEACDGSRSVESIAAEVESSVTEVEAVLGELSHRGLVVGSAEASASLISRRRFAAQAAGVAAASALVWTVAAPLPAAAPSQPLPTVP